MVLIVWWENVEVWWENVEVWWENEEVLQVCDDILVEKVEKIKYY